MTESTGRGRGGYPPKEHRWPKGQSGNPRGRPRKPRNEEFADLVRKHLNKKVKITIDGRVRTLTMLEAASAQLVNDLFKGSPRERQRALEWLQKRGFLDKVATSPLPDPAALQKFLAQLAEEVERSDEWDCQHRTDFGRPSSSD